MAILLLLLFYWTERKVNITPWNLLLECILPGSHKGEAAAQCFFWGQFCDIIARVAIIEMNI